MEFGVIEQRMLLGASREEAYDAIADLNLHAVFTGTAVTGRSRVGGDFSAGEGYISKRFLFLQRGKKTVHEWKTSEAGRVSHVDGRTDVQTEGWRNRTDLDALKGAGGAG